MRWSGVSGAKGYFIYRRTDASEQYTVAGASQAESYTDVRLAIGTTYYYRVSAYNSDADESPLSLEASASTQVINKIVGKFTDSRDGKEYKTATIGGKTWMAENLNYDPQRGNSWCYDDVEANCGDYGRLYDWATAMNINTSFNNAELGGDDSNRQGVCPAGWRLPSVQDWEDLGEAAGGYYADGTGNRLKATNGWRENGNGTDDYGFSALPGGSYDYRNGSFNVNGYHGQWWTATERNRSAEHRAMSYNSNNVTGQGDAKSYGFSVRCVRN